jgi:hypothetical protein
MANYIEPPKLMRSAFPSIIELTRRAVNAWHRDGIPTMVGGIGYTLMGLTLVPFRTPYHAFSYAMLWICVIVVHSLGETVIPGLKARFTYRRTGYVAPVNLDSSLIESDFISITEPDFNEAELREEQRRVLRARQARALVALGIVLALVTAAGDVSEQHHNLFAFSAVMVMVAFLTKPSFYRFTVLEFLGCPALALLIARFPIARNRGIGLLLILLGLFSFSRGLIVFIRYMQKTSAAVP